MKEKFLPNFSTAEVVSFFKNFLNLLLSTINFTKGCKIVLLATIQEKLSGVSYTGKWEPICFLFGVVSFSMYVEFF